MAVSGSGKGIQIVVGTDYNDRDLKRAQRDLDRLKGEAAKTATPMQKLGATLRQNLGPALAMAGAAAAAFATKLAIDGVKAAIADEAAARKLAQTLTNLGEAHRTADVENFITELQMATGVVDDEMRPAFERLVRSTGNVDEAQRALSIALDISAGRGKSLELVANSLGKAYDGNANALGRLGLGVDSAILKTGNMQVITGELSRLFAGQAAQAADTFQGQIQRVSVAFDELQESFGAGFLSGLGDSSSGTDDLVDSIRDLQPALEALGEQIGGAIKSLGELSSGLTQTAEDLNIPRSEGAKNFLEYFIGIPGLLKTAAGALGLFRSATEDQDDVNARIVVSHADYRDAVVRVGQAASTSVTYVDEFGNSVTESGEDAEDAAEKFDLFAAAIAKTDQVVAFRQAIDEVGGAFKRTNTPVNIFGEKGQENFDTLKGLIERTASYAESVDGVASQAAIASQGLSSLEGAFKNAKMDPATRALLLEPFQALIDDLSEAGVDVTNLQIKLDSLKSKNITVTTEYRFTGSNKQAFFEADGGRIAGRGFGVPRGSDTVPAMLTPGEFVVRKSAVDKFGAGLFSQLNRGINPLAGMSPTGSGRAGGFSIGTINVTSVAGERAETSLPRALRRAAFLAGVNG
jgi:hypothetical protein